jgi:putative hemolysin
MKKTLLLVGVILILTSCKLLDEIAEKEYSPNNKAPVQIQEPKVEKQEPVACSAEEPCDEEKVNTPPPPVVEVANPASVYCVDIGGILEISNEDKSVGICKFPDGTECEEWALYRNECEGHEHEPLGKTRSPQGVYCEKNGGMVSIVENEFDISIDCTFPNGVVCDAYSFMSGLCSNEKQEEDLADVDIKTQYCLDEGGTIEVFEDNGLSENICIFMNGNQCSVDDLYNGECLGHEAYINKTNSEDISPSKAEEDIPADAELEDMPELEVPATE